MQQGAPWGRALFWRKPSALGGLPEEQRDERLVHVREPAFAVAVEAGHREVRYRLAERLLELLDLDFDAAVRAVEQNAGRGRRAELCRALRERALRIAHQ